MPTFVRRRALGAMLAKEFRQIVRNRAILAQLLVIPVAELLLLGNAATREVRAVRTVVVDRDHSPASRALTAQLRANPRFIIEPTASTPLGMQQLDGGHAALLLELPRGYGASPTQRANLVADAVDGSKAGIATQYVQGTIATGAAPNPAAPVTRYLFNPTLDFPHFFVPALLAELVLLVGVLVAALNIVREKELGTLEQLSVTPLTRGEFLLAKLLPFFAAGVLETALGLVAARALFGIEVAGSLSLLFVGVSLFLLGVLGIGLFVSTISETQQQATFVAVFLVMIMLLMSGTFTPVASMPGWAQVVSAMIPMTHMASIMRAVVLRGAGLGALRPELIALALTALVTLSASAWRYRKTTA